MVIIKLKDYGNVKAKDTFGTDEVIMLGKRCYKDKEYYICKIRETGEIINVETKYGEIIHSVGDMQ